MIVRGSNIPGNILTTHLPLSRRKKGDGPLVHREIYFKPKNSKATPLAQIACPPTLMVGLEFDVIKFNPGEDDLMNDDTTMDDGNAYVVPTPGKKLKSTITYETSRLSDGSPDNTKRSFRKEIDGKHNSHFAVRK